jgi:hypothetical protein
MAHLVTDLIIHSNHCISARAKAARFACLLVPPLHYCLQHRLAADTTYHTDGSTYGASHNGMPPRSGNIHSSLITLTMTTHLDYNNMHQDAPATLACMLTILSRQSVNYLTKQDACEWAIHFSGLAGAQHWEATACMRQNICHSADHI